MASVRNFVSKPVVWMAGAAVVVLVGIALALTQPWTAFIDREVDEEFPVAFIDLTADDAGTPTTPPATTESEPAEADTPAPSPTAATDTSDPAPEPSFTVLASGEFVPKDKAASGVAALVEFDDGNRFLRIEDLATSDGPDVFIYLSTAPVGASNGEIAAAEFVNLGSMRGNVGNLTYDIPDDADLDRYASVVIWCERFTSAFGAAPLAG